MKPIRFIHTADLHLDTPFIGLQALPQPIFDRVRNSTFTAFQKVIDTAMKQQVDFLLISGDLYDGENRSLRAQLYLRKELERLAKCGIHTYIIHGNHDHLDGNWTRITWPEGVHFFGVDVSVIPFKKNGETLANIYGFSYPRRAVTENMTIHYQKRLEAGYHIGMLHGSHQTTVEHDHYAPFTKQELLAKDFNYWALGHIHKRDVLHQEPPIVYPGNIQGRHVLERGEKGCYVVDLDSKQAKLTFIPTSDIVWMEESVSITGMHTIDELYEHIHQLKETLRAAGYAVLLTVAIHGKGELYQTLLETEVQTDLLTLLNEDEEMNRTFIWMVNFQNETTPQFNKEMLREEPSFIGDLLKTFDDYQDLDQVLEPLFEQSKVKKLLDPLTEQEKREILIEAENDLLTQLLKR